VSIWIKFELNQLAKAHSSAMWHINTFFHIFAAAKGKRKLY